MNRHSVRTVNAVDFLFRPLHAAPLLSRKIEFGVLPLLLADVARDNTPRGSKSSYLPTGMSKLLQNRYARKGVLSLLISADR